MPYLRCLALAVAATLSTAVPVAEAQAPTATSVRFRPHDIADIRGGYAVAVADFNNDGRLDVIANSLGGTDVAWLENPTWERHVVVPEARGVAFAPAYECFPVA